MTSIIWGAFGLMLVLVVVVGAVIQYIKDRNKYKKAKVDEWNKAVATISVVPVEPVVVKPDISEPVTSFIKCFKDNPKRFKVKQVLSKDYYEFSDIQANKSWVFYYFPESMGRYGCYIIGADWMTEDEKEAVVSAVSPHFTTERHDRLHAIQRERLTRIYKESVDV